MAARERVECMRFELYTDAVPVLESVLQHEVLRFRVDARALPRCADPGAADLNAAVRWGDVHETRSAHDLAGIAQGGREGDRGAGLSRVEALFDKGTHVSGLAHVLRHPAPDRGIEANSTQGVDVA